MTPEVPWPCSCDGSSLSRRRALAPAFAGALMLSACATTTVGQQVANDVHAQAETLFHAPIPTAPPKQYQWLHGSAEAAILSRQAYDGMVRYVADALARRARGQTVESAVLATGAAPEAPRWTPCGDKPPAVVLDMDETAILNTGANYDAAVRGDPPFDAARWAAWEKDGAAFVEAVPGAADALTALRARGVTVVFNSNREDVHAAGAAAALRAAGLGEAKSGETLFLRGDVAPGSGKDPRRAAIAARYCVLAMAGDQLGDFSDRFNDKALSVQARRALGQAAAVRGRWGAGWFLLPNPLYGPGVTGSFADVFPADKRWTPSP